MTLLELLTKTIECDRAISPVEKHLTELRNNLAAGTDEFSVLLRQRTKLQNTRDRYKKQLTLRGLTVAQARLEIEKEGNANGITADIINVLSINGLIALAEKLGTTFMPGHTGETLAALRKRLTALVYNDTTEPATISAPVANTHYGAITAEVRSEIVTETYATDEITGQAVTLTKGGKTITGIVLYNVAYSIDCLHVRFDADELCSIGIPIGFAEARRVILPVRVNPGQALQLLGINECTQLARLHSVPFYPGETLAILRSKLIDALFPYYASEVASTDEDDRLVTISTGPCTTDELFTIPPFKA